MHHQIHHDRTNQVEPQYKNRNKLGQWRSAGLFLHCSILRLREYFTYPSLSKLIECKCAQGTLLIGSLSTWTAYRKTEPLRWTSYMDDCLRILVEGGETESDFHLATQVKCQIITNQLNCAAANDSRDMASSKSYTALLATALLQQLDDIQHRLPVQVYSESQYLVFSEEVQTE
jgi:hypothetical protein